MARVSFSPLTAMCMTTGKLACRDFYVNKNVVPSLGNEASPDSLEGQDEATELTEPRVTLRNAGNTSYSPTRHMHMRISYAERDGEGK